MKRLTVLVAAALVALTFGASSIAAAATPAPGKFKSTLTGTGARTDHGKLDGTWTLDLTGSGTVVLTVGGHTRGGGTYKISGDKITFTPAKGHTCSTKGAYRFRLHDKKLRFTVVRDTCTPRRDILTFGLWRKLR